MSLDALVRLHEGLARLGPGLPETTRAAVDRCRPLLPDHPRVADVGCGTGAATLELARALDASVVALDLFAAFLADLRRSAGRSALARRVTPVAADMGALPFRPRSFDLLWSEGAIYILGFRPGLAAWLPLVRPGGLLAVTEATWLTDSPPASVRARWAEWYPAMGTVASNRAAAQELGLEVVDTFTVPGEAWWAYYRPLLARCDALEPDADPDLAAVIAEARTEAALHAAHGDTYGYVFYILRSPDHT